MTATALREAPPTLRYRVIRNPRAGEKKGIAPKAITPDQLVALLERHGLGSDVVETLDKEAARREARRAVRDGVDVVIAAGGDGTIGAVASGLLGTDVALGVLPMGTVMNIARMLGVPRDLEAAATALGTGERRRVDVGEVAGRPFYEAASVGMNAAMFREANQFEKGDWLAILRTIWVALRYRPARMHIDLDGAQRVRTRALMVVMALGPYIGAGMTVAPEARLADGKFEVRVFRGFSKLELLRHLAGIAFGRYRYAPHVSTYRAATVRVTSHHPLPCRADSLDLGTTPLEISVRPNVLCVIVPRQSPSGGRPRP
jgi:diacylglycerol kinase (ATP)